MDLSSLFKFINIKKLTAVIVVNCFLFSFVCAPAISGIAANIPSAEQYRQIFKDFSLPYNYGKITKAHYAGTDRVVINIQDLHCHPKVQKNISNIIDLFDRQYGINNIYLEGAYGDVDTGWLTEKLDEKEKADVLTRLVETGKLTGVEYYSALTGRNKIIKGLEKKEPYLDNLKRFGAILESQDNISVILKGIEESVKELKKKYYTRRQYKIEKLSKDFSSGRISPDKYYSLLSKHTDKLGIDLYKYENTLAYIMLLSLQKELNYSKITEDLQNLVLLLKEQLPYNAYKLLVDNTKNFSETDKLYEYIGKTAKLYSLDLDVNFKELNKYFNYIELSQKINPLELVAEEDALTQEINTRFSETKAQRDAVFITHFEKYLKDYLLSKITAGDYEYYKENIDRYRELWNKYIDNRVFSLLEPYIKEADIFYEINTDRNRYFTDNMFDGVNTEKTGNLKTDDSDIDNIIGNMKSVKRIDVVLTGGFHSGTVGKILEEQGVSYIVVTPNVSGGIKKAEETYYKIAKEQKRILFQALATLPVSLYGYDARVRTAVKSFGEETAKKIFGADAVDGVLRKYSGIEEDTLIDSLALKAQERQVQMAKILDSDDTGNIKQEIINIIKNAVKEDLKDKVSEELLEKADIEKLSEILDNSEELNKLVELLSEKNNLKKSFKAVIGEAEHFAEYINNNIGLGGVISNSINESQKRDAVQPKNKFVSKISKKILNLFLPVVILSALIIPAASQPVKASEAKSSVQTVQNADVGESASAVTEITAEYLWNYLGKNNTMFRPGSKKDLAGSIEMSKTPEAEKLINRIFSDLEKSGFDVSARPDIIFMTGSNAPVFSACACSDINVIIIPVDKELPERSKVISAVAHELTHINNASEVASGKMSKLEDEARAVEAGYILDKTFGHNITVTSRFNKKISVNHVAGMEIYAFSAILDNKDMIEKKFRELTGDKSLTFNNIYYSAKLYAPGNNIGIPEEVTYKGLKNTELAVELYYGSHKIIFIVNTGININGNYSEKNPKQIKYSPSVRIEVPADVSQSDSTAISDFIYGETHTTGKTSRKMSAANEGDRTVKINDDITASLSENNGEDKAVVSETDIEDVPLRFEHEVLSEEQEAEQIKKDLNGAEYEIFYLNEGLSEEQIKEKLVNAISAGKYLAVYPDRSSAVPSSSRELFNLYKNISFMSFVKNILPDTSGVSGTKYYDVKNVSRFTFRYLLKEMVKNAFVHGNSLNFTKPLYLKFSVGKDGVLSAVILNRVSEETADSAEFELAAKAGLHGEGLGKKQARADASYSESTENGLFKIELKDIYGKKFSGTEEFADEIIGFNDPDKYFIRKADIKRNFESSEELYKYISDNEDELLKKLTGTGIPAEGTFLYGFYTYLKSGSLSAAQQMLVLKAVSEYQKESGSGRDLSRIFKDSKIEVLINNMLADTASSDASNEAYGNNKTEKLMPETSEKTMTLNKTESVGMISVNNNGIQTVEDIKKILKLSERIRENYSSGFDLSNIKLSKKELSDLWHLIIENNKNEEVQNCLITIFCKFAEQGKNLQQFVYFINNMNQKGIDGTEIYKMLSRSDCNNLLMISEMIYTDNIKTAGDIKNILALSGKISKIYGKFFDLGRIKYFPEKITDLYNLAADKSKNSETQIRILCVLLDKNLYVDRVFSFVNGLPENLKDFAGLDKILEPLNEEYINLINHLVTGENINTAKDIKDVINFAEKLKTIYGKDCNLYSIKDLSKQELDDLYSLTDGSDENAEAMIRIFCNFLEKSRSVKASLGFINNLKQKGISYTEADKIFGTLDAEYMVPVSDLLANGTAETTDDISNIYRVLYEIHGNVWYSSDMNKECVKFLSKDKIKYLQNLLNTRKISLSENQQNIDMGNVTAYAVSIFLRFSDFNEAVEIIRDFYDMKFPLELITGRFDAKEIRVIHELLKENPKKAEYIKSALNMLCNTSGRLWDGDEYIDKLKALFKNDSVFDRVKKDRKRMLDLLHALNEAKIERMALEFNSLALFIFFNDNFKKTVKKYIKKNSKDFGYLKSDILKVYRLAVDVSRNIAEQSLKDDKSMDFESENFDGIIKSATEDILGTLEKNMARVLIDNNTRVIAVANSETWKNGQKRFTFEGLNYLLDKVKSKRDPALETLIEPKKGEEIAAMNQFLNTIRSLNGNDSSVFIKFIGHGHKEGFGLVDNTAEVVISVQEMAESIFAAYLNGMSPDKIFIQLSCCESYFSPRTLYMYLTDKIREYNDNNENKLEFKYPTIFGSAGYETEFGYTVNPTEEHKFFHANEEEGLMTLLDGRKSGDKSPLTVGDIAGSKMVKSDSTLYLFDSSDGLQKDIKYGKTGILNKIRDFLFNADRILKIIFGPISGMLRSQRNISMSAFIPALSYTTEIKDEKDSKKETDAEYFKNKALPVTENGRIVELAQDKLFKFKFFNKETEIKNPVIKAAIAVIIAPFAERKEINRIYNGQESEEEFLKKHKGYVEGDEQIKQIYRQRLGAILYSMSEIKKVTGLKLILNLTNIIVHSRLNIDAVKNKTMFLNKDQNEDMQREADCYQVIESLYEESDDEDTRETFSILQKKDVSGLLRGSRYEITLILGLIVSLCFDKNKEDKDEIINILGRYDYLVESFKELSYEQQIKIMQTVSNKNKNPEESVNIVFSLMNIFSACQSTEDAFRFIDAVEQKNIDWSVIYFWDSKNQGYLLLTDMLEYNVIQTTADMEKIQKIFTANINNENAESNKNIIRLSEEQTDYLADLADGKYGEAGITEKEIAAVTRIFTVLERYDFNTVKDMISDFYRSGLNMSAFSYVVSEDDAFLNVLKALKRAPEKAKYYNKILSCLGSLKIKLGISKIHLDKSEVEHLLTFSRRQLDFICSVIDGKNRKFTLNENEIPALVKFFIKQEPSDFGALRGAIADFYNMNLNFSIPFMLENFNTDNILKIHDLLKENPEKITYCGQILRLLENAGKVEFGTIDDYISEMLSFLNNDSVTGKWNDYIMQNLFDGLFNAHICKLALENNGLAISVLLDEGFLAEVERNINENPADFGYLKDDIVKVYRLAIDVSRKIVEQNVKNGKVMEITTDDVKATTVYLFDKLKNNMSRELINDSTKVIGIVNNEIWTQDKARPSDVGKRRFTFDALNILLDKSKHNRDKKLEILIDSGDGKEEKAKKNYLKKIANLNSNEDSVFIFFDGHGSKDALWITDSLTISVEELGNAVFQAYLRGMPLDKITVNLSCCNSYYFARSLYGYLEDKITKYNSEYNISSAETGYPVIWTSAGYETEFGYTVYSPDKDTLSHANEWKGLLALKNEQSDGTPLTVGDIVKAKINNSNSTLFLYESENSSERHDNELKYAVYTVDTVEFFPESSVNVNIDAGTTTVSEWNEMTSEDYYYNYNRNNTGTSDRYFLNKTVSLPAGVTELTADNLFKFRFLNKELDIKNPVIRAAVAIFIAPFAESREIRDIFYEKDEQVRQEKIKTFVNKHNADSEIVEERLNKLLSAMDTAERATGSRLIVHMANIAVHRQMNIGAVKNSIAAAVDSAKKNINPFGISQNTAVKIIESDEDIAELEKSDIDIKRTFVVAESEADARNLRNQGINAVTVKTEYGKRGGSYIGRHHDTGAVIRAKWNVDKNNNKTEIVFCIKGQTHIEKEEIMQMLVNESKTGNKNKFFEGTDQIIITNGQTFEGTVNAIKNNYTDSVSVPGKELKLDISESKDKNINGRKLESVCINEKASTGTDTFIINFEQAETCRETIEQLRKEGSEFIVSYKNTDDAEEILFDGIKIDASNVKSFSEIEKKLKNIKNNALEHGVGISVSVKFSDEVYAEFIKNQTDIFSEYGIMPIADIATSGKITGKKEIEDENITEKNFEKILTDESVTGIVLDEKTKNFISKNKDKLKTAESKGQKYNKGYNASLSSKFDYTATDIKALEVLLNTDVLSPDADLKEIFDNLPENILSSDAQSYLKYLSDKGRYEEAAGFIRGVAMNSARNEIIAGFAKHNININIDKFKKDAGGKYQKALLTLAVQLITEGQNITGLLNTDYIESDTISAKDFIESVKGKINANLEDILKQNEFKIEKLSDVSQAIAEFKEFNVLLQDRFLEVGVAAEVKISALAVKSILSAA